MTRMTSAGRMPRAMGALMVQRVALDSPGSGRARTRSLSALADFVKTFVDRTIDVARGRFDM